MKYVFLGGTGSTRPRIANNCFIRQIIFASIDGMSITVTYWKWLFFVVYPESGIVGQEDAGLIDADNRIPLQHYFLQIGLVADKNVTSAHGGGGTKTMLMRLAFLVSWFSLLLIARGNQNARYTIEYALSILIKTMLTEFFLKKSSSLLQLNNIYQDHSIGRRKITIKLTLMQLLEEGVSKIWISRKRITRYHLHSYLYLYTLCHYFTSF